MPGRAVNKNVRVFCITGTSTDFGKHLVQEVLDNGDIAVATARKPSLSNALPQRTTTPSNSTSQTPATSNQPSQPHLINSATSMWWSTMQDTASMGLVKSYQTARSEQNRSQSLRLDQHYEEGCGGHEGSEAQWRVDSTSYLYWRPRRSANVQHLLRLQMGRRRLHRSPLPQSQTRMKHTLHMRRARWSPHRLGRTLRGLPRPSPPSLRSRQRQRSNGEAE